MKTKVLPGTLTRQRDHGAGTLETGQKTAPDPAAAAKQGAEHAGGADGSSDTLTISAERALQGGVEPTPSDQAIDVGGAPVQPARDLAGLVQLVRGTSDAGSPLVRALEQRLHHAGLPMPDLSAFPAERVAQVTELFRPDNLRLSMAQSQLLRQQVVEDERGAEGFRFKNCWETRTSGAQASPEKRAMHEAFRLGLSVNDYLATPARERPHYGYLQFRRGLTETQVGDLHLGQFGEDIWEFDAGKLADRATITVGDSFTLRNLSEYLLAPYLRSDWSTFALADDQVTNPLREGHEVFLPLRPAFMAPVFQHVLDEYDRDGFRQRPLLKRRLVAEPTYVWKDPYSTDRVEGELTNFYEVQLFDPQLDLSKVRRFTFTEAPPAGDFLRVLEEHGIEIYDWRDRSQTPRPWSPEP